MSWADETDAISLEVNVGPPEVSFDRSGSAIIGIEFVV
jgi:hypothetical protein